MKKLLLAPLLLAFCLPSLAESYRTLDQVSPAYQEAAKMLKMDFADPNVRENAQKQNIQRANESYQPTAHWTVPAQGSQPAVELYVYKPKSVAGKLPVIYYIHGGGYILGNAKAAGDNLQAIAEANKAAVISVEYRLATVAPFPADLNDAYHGLSYVYKNAGKLGLDKEKVVLMGESAGGGLAARLALFTRDKGEFTPEGQVLIYPMLDYRTGTPESPYDTKNLGEFLWTESANRLGWATLRGNQTISDEQLPYFSPAFAKKLSGLPRTYMMVGDLDLFVAEDLNYASRLIQAAVPTELQVFPGLFHAFEAFNKDGKQTKEYEQSRNQAIQEMFSHPVK
ncbi:alpha/beta hydrolase [[Mannheimia] succiniciproducens]|nr:alpha/beta hydrolase [[Mannheimia] succiniciproducens]